MKNKEKLMSNQEKENELSENKNKRSWLVSGVVTILLIVIIFDLYI